MLALTLSAAASEAAAPAIFSSEHGRSTVTLDEYHQRLVLLACARGAW